MITTKVHPHAHGAQFSQSVEVDLFAHVPVGRRCDARDNVVVIPATEVLVLHSGAVVHGGVEDLGHLAVEHSVQ